MILADVLGNRLRQQRQACAADHLEARYTFGPRVARCDAHGPGPRRWRGVEGAALPIAFRGRARGGALVRAALLWSETASEIGDAES